MATIVVPDDHLTIAAALAAAGALDEVHVRAGTYSEGNLYVACAALRAFPGDGGSVTVDGSGVAQDTIRVHTAATIADLDIVGNAAKECVQLNASNATVEDCSFSGTYSNGIQSTAPTGATLRRLRFLGTCPAGYAIELGTTTGHNIENILVAGAHNRGIRPGGGALSHATVDGTTSHGYYLDAACAVRDCSAVDCGGSGFYLNHAGCSVDYAHTDGNGSPYTIGGGGGTWGAHSVAGAPLFVGGGDYHPGPGSPLRDAGTDVGATDDTAGDPRPVGSGPDIGAYEWQGVPPQVLSASCPDLRTVLVEFDQAMSSGTVETASEWAIASVIGGDPVTVSAAEHDGDRTVRLTTTAHTPDAVYRVTAPATAESALGDPVDPAADTADYVTPAASVLSDELWGFLAQPTVDAAEAVLPMLHQAILAQLFTDARALDSDGDPLGDEDPRGWAGDYYAPVGRAPLGSRLWVVLAGGRASQQTAAAAESVAREALQGLVSDGIANAVDVAVEVVDPSAETSRGGLRMTVTVDGQPLVFPDLWSAWRAFADAE
jgi:phage gp46-like protein